MGVRVLAGAALMVTVVLGGLLWLTLAHAQWSSSSTSSGSINAGSAVVLMDISDTTDIKPDESSTPTPTPTPTPVVLPAVQLPTVGGVPPSEGGSSLTALLYILMVGAAAIAAAIAAGAIAVAAAAGGWYARRRGGSG